MLLEVSVLATGCRWELLVTMDRGSASIDVWAEETWHLPTLPAQGHLLLRRLELPNILLLQVSVQSQNRCRLRLDDSS